MAERKTIQYFQWLRALGAVGIVILHAFFTRHNTEGIQLTEFESLLDGLVGIVCGRWAVPVFFMMSGALMLDPEREMGWKKTLGHVWRLGFVLLTFGFAFCLIEAYVDAGNVSLAMVGTAILRLLTARSWDHLWFVYQLMGFYLVTPLIRPWVALASREEYGRVTLVACLLLLGLKGLSAFIPRASLYYGFEVPYCFAYYLLGSYLHRFMELDTRWVSLGIVSLLATILLWRPLGYTWSTDPNRGVVAPFAILVMLAAKRYLEVPITRYPLMALLADYSFGIYLVHPAFQHVLMLSPKVVALPLLPANFLLTVLPLVASVATIWLLRFLPGFKGKV